MESKIAETNKLTMREIFGRNWEAGDSGEKNPATRSVGTRGATVWQSAVFRRRVRTPRQTRTGHREISGCHPVTWRHRCLPSIEKKRNEAKKPDCQVCYPERAREIVQYTEGENCTKRVRNHPVLTEDVLRSTSNFLVYIYIYIYIYIITSSRLG